jgi:RNA polymerase sigma-70 factor (ECF subfamily)
MSTDAMTTVQSNADIIRRAQEGDADAFASLFHAHKARIYGVCLRMTKSPAESEDLTQEAFLFAFRKLATFRGESGFYTWLYRIATNTVLMHFRKRSIPQISFDQPYSDELGGKSLPREYRSTDLRLTHCVDRIALTKAIEDLPAGYRTIFLLHEVDGYEHHEIAALLGCSTGNSKSQLHKARLRMRDFLLHLRKPQTSPALSASSRGGILGNGSLPGERGRWRKRGSESGVQRASASPFAGLRLSHRRRPGGAGYSRRRREANSELRATQTRNVEAVGQGFQACLCGVCSVAASKMAGEETARSCAR